MARQAIPSQAPGSALRFVVSDPGRDGDFPGSIPRNETQEQPNQQVSGGSIGAAPPVCGCPN